MNPAVISGQVSMMKSAAARGSAVSTLTARRYQAEPYQAVPYQRALMARGSAPAGQATDTPATGTNEFLGKEDFLKLLVTQLRCQTATDPVDQRELIAQMAQLASLEEMQNLRQGVSDLLHSQLTLQAAGLVGKTVVATGPDGGKIEGTVQEVRFNDGVPVLIVGDKEVPLTQVVSVR